MKCLHVVLAFGVSALTTIVSSRPADAVIQFTGATYSENFDVLPSTGTDPIAWSNDSTLPGWSLFRQPESAISAIPTIRVGTGSSNAGSMYSFGVAGVNDIADRALGGVASSNVYFGTPGPSSNAVAAWIAVALTNATAGSIDSVTLSYDGEQWRDGGDSNGNDEFPPVAQTMVLEYGIGASFDAVTWTAPGSAFDFESPIFSATGRALDGNDAANRAAGRGGAISGLTWNVGETLWVRWIERNDPNNDHGLAIDNFSLSAGGGVPTENNADFNNDGVVNGEDYLIWQSGFGLTDQTGKSNGNANTDTVVDGLDFTEWAAKFGGPPALAAAAGVPEPGALTLAALALAGARGACRRQRRR